MNPEQRWLLEEKYHGIQSEEFAADCRRLEAGEPLAYIIGHVPFLGCTIYLDSRPLIPRPETEFWTQQAIASGRAQAPQQPRTVLDLCAGSGCVGVAIAHHLPHVTVTFGELDAHHLPTIEKNLRHNTAHPERHRLVVSDLFAAITDQFDLIVCNPPYIDPALDRTQPSVKAYEPHLALYGGTAGLDPITRTVEQVQQHLTPHGALWLEHEPEQAATIVATCASLGLNAVTHTDQYGVARFSVITMAQ